MDFEIVGIGGAVLVLLIVQVIKQIWPSLDGSKWIILIAIGLGVALAVLAKLSALFPDVGAWVSTVFTGLIAALAAMGIYSGQKKLRE